MCPVFPDAQKHRVCVVDKNQYIESHINGVCRWHCPRRSPTVCALSSILTEIHFIHESFTAVMSQCPCHQDKCILCEALLFSGLSGTQVCRMHGMITKRVYYPKDVLFHESSPATHLFLLKSGFVKLTTALPDGRSQVLRLGAAWQFLGIEALGDQRYPYAAEAATEVSVCMIRYKDLLRVLESNPPISIRVIQALNRELQRSNDMIRNLGLMSSTERVASFLLSMAPNGSAPDEELPMPLSRKDMAEMLGLTVETVSRVVSKLMRDAIIHAPAGRNQFRILDHERLRAASGTKQ